MVLRTLGPSPLLKVFLTLSANDLKEIGLDKFGPRRKMTNAIESWHKETSALSAHSTEAGSLSSHMERLQLELHEKNTHLNQVTPVPSHPPLTEEPLVF